jgi:hypothetical protein
VVHRRHAFDIGSQHPLRGFASADFNRLAQLGDRCWLSSHQIFPQKV